MNVIGRFQRTEDGYAGVIKTLTVERDLSLVATPSAKDNAPSHRVYMDGMECGVAWAPPKRATGVLHLKLEDPAFDGALRGILVGGEGDEFLLLWRRPPS